MKPNTRKIKKNNDNKKSELKLIGPVDQIHLLLDKQKFHLKISLEDTGGIKTLELGLRDIPVLYEFLRDQKEESPEMFSGKTTTETEISEREDYLYYKRESKGGTMVNTPASREDAESRWCNKKKNIYKIEIVKDYGWYVKFAVYIKKSVIPFTVYILGICGNHSKKTTGVSRRLTTALGRLINKDKFYKKSMGIANLIPGDLVIGRGNITEDDFDLVYSLWEDEDEKAMERLLNRIISDHAGCGI